MDLQETIDRAGEGATVEVPPGTTEASLVIDKSITLRGAGPGKSVIDGKKRGSCVLVGGAKAKVRLCGLSLVNGGSDVGGCIAFRLGELLELEDCLLEGGSALAYGGGGALLAGKKARLCRVRVTRCRGQQGGGILVDEECEAELWACALFANAASWGAGLRVKEAARVRLLHCTLAEDAGSKKGPGGEIAVDGTMTRTPELEVVNCILVPKGDAPAITSAGKFSGKVALRHSLLPKSAEGAFSGEGVLFGTPWFLPVGKHRCALSAESAGAGKADPAATPPGLLDLMGRPLAAKGHADMGAYAVSMPA
ncbi:MAG: hypothetical protein HYZ28_28255 [Myxococcales bacterium]|nr:hypothetical protein [Myxococcales bacterium]